MIQTGFLDTVTGSTHIPKGRLKNNPTPATAILHDDTEGLARQEYWNYPSIIGQLNYLAQNSWQYHLPFINAHDSLKNQRLYMKNQSNASYITCNAQEKNHSS
jgi:hypothetical protein